MVLKSIYGVYNLDKSMDSSRIYRDVQVPLDGVVPGAI